MIILAGDVGGTKVNLALCRFCAEQDQYEIVLEYQKRYLSHEFKSLSEIVKAYIADLQHELKIDVACFGVPGPVLDGRCQTTNLPWLLDQYDLVRDLQIPNVHLINDLEATAYGILQLRLSSRKNAEIYTIKPNLDLHQDAALVPSATQALLAPGTGLGEALLIGSAKRQSIVASEGGHTDFAPQDEQQIEFLRWLWTRHKHVSAEHVCAGPGIYRIYRFLRDTKLIAESDLRLQNYLEESNLEKLKDDPSQRITEVALQGGSQLCQQTLDFWLFCLGAEAGNLALKTLSMGGVYLAGGIVPKIIPLFSRAAFIEGFQQKGRMAHLMRKIPVFAMTNPLLPIYGAAYYGAEKMLQ